MVCPSDQIATNVSDGAKDKIDGCISCLPGSYSFDGILIICSDSNCPAGQIATKSSAINNTDGWTICSTIEISIIKIEIDRCSFSIFLI
jgi:hypothetical protein